MKNNDLSSKGVSLLGHAIHLLYVKTVLKPIELQFPECVSVHPVRVLFSWLLPVQIQRCVPFPSYAAPIVRRLPSCLPASWPSHSLWMCTLYVHIYTVCVLCVCVRGIVVKRNRAWKNCSKSFDFVSTWESPCVPKHCLTPLRSETDKRGHEEIFPHDDVTAWGEGGCQTLFRVWLSFLPFLKCYPSLLVLVLLLLKTNCELCENTS